MQCSMVNESCLFRKVRGFYFAVPGDGMKGWWRGGGGSKCRSNDDWRGVGDGVGGGFLDDCPVK